MGNAITINAVAFSFNGGGKLYKPMLDLFNQYSVDNKLDITVKLDLYTAENSTSLVTDYESMLDSIVKSDKYDIYFYDNIYSAKFGKYLLNLKEWLSEEHLNLYTQGVASQSCVYKDKLVGLPITIDFSVLYSNPEYLNKYNIPVPSTWEELVESGKYILNEEAKLGNTDLYTYNGLFNLREAGTCSLYEFIFSYRNSVDSPFPKIPGEESIDALEMLKKMKQEINNLSQFDFPDEFTSKLLFTNENFIFLKYWYFPTVTKFVLSALPGVKQGISGSVIGGYNIGISDVISETRKQAAVTAFQYLTSKSMQKDFIIKRKLFSAIPSLYDEDDVCEQVDCTFFKSIQLIARPTAKSSDYSSYSEYFRNYIYEFLYGDASAYDVLKKIDDLSRFYYLSLDRTDGSIGLIIVSLFGIISLIMLLSLRFLFINKFKSFFKFIPGDMWIITVFGCILIMCTCFTGLGEITILKCQIKVLLLSIGFTFSLIPVFTKLASSFPDDNPISYWINKNKYIVLFVFVLCDILLYSLAYNDPYEIEDIMVPEGKNFQKCKPTKSGSLMVNLTLGTKIIIILCLLFFTFVEWNMELIRNDIRYLSVALYMDVISIGVLLIIKYMNLDNYIIYYTMTDVLYMFFATTNYIFLYGYRIFRAMIKKESDDELFIKNFRKNSSSNNNIYMMDNNSSSNKQTTSSNSTKENSQISSKILNYHYRKNNTDYSSNSTDRKSVV